MTFRVINRGDADALRLYYDNLPIEDRSWFKPHSFEIEKIRLMINEVGDSLNPYIAIDEGARIIAYFFVFKGITENDQRRIERAGICLADMKIYSFAPSVARDFKGTGLADRLFFEIELQLIKTGIDCLVLQGGVNATNVRAISYYKKIGFVSAGEFERGEESNFAMYKMLSTN